MTQLIIDHPFYLLGIIVFIAMFFVTRELYRDIHEFHTKHHDHNKHSKSLY
jgi:hypothetical protein